VKAEPDNGKNGRERKSAMKALTLIALTFAAAGAPAHGTELIPSVGLVHVDESDVDTYYNYLAALPVFRYYDGGVCSATPLLTDVVDGGPTPTDEGLSASHLLVIGAARTESVDATREAFGVAASGVVSVDGEVPAVAAALATNWAQALNVVVAPYAPSADGTLSADASYAAALASALNAPLLFTYTKRVPPETLTALRRLGAKNVHLVDFGGRCDEGVRARLGAEGRFLGRTFDRPDEVTSFVEKHLRSSRPKGLPRSA
jgi:hypothetical protein